jgi:tetratricopeptide (TPR) repeat protein
MKSRSEASVRAPSRLTQFGVCGAIVVLIWAVFGQTLWYDFVNFDDKVYVYGNPLVSSGLSWNGVLRAFSDAYTNNWHPLTLVSHMADCQIYGLKAGGHHFTNALLHTFAAMLLFIWLHGATGRSWNSAFVTALFAIHPLRVESVAWVAERKDVLSGVFFFLALIAYVRYARGPSLARYLLISILFACGLMSKPMLVTTPAILLLLDFWPLRRSQASDGIRWAKLVAEKIPLFALSAGASLVALVLQVDNPTSVGQLPFAWRLENALVSYVIYIWQIFWPRDLAVFYPHPDDALALWQVGLASALLIATTLLVWKLRHTRPYLLFGWLWYLIMLLPVIGIIEVGLQGRADRYTYLPHLGLYVAITWLVVDLSGSWARGKEILAPAAGAALIALSLLAWKQTTYWRNSEALWTHALAVTKDNDVALTNFGDMLMERGELDQALSKLQAALAIRSRSEHSHYRFSLALIHDLIGNVLARQGHLAEAMANFREAISLRPDYQDSHYNLGVLLFKKGEVDNAITEWRNTLSKYPNDPGTNLNLANALVQKGLFREAISRYEITLRSEPDSPLGLNNLAWLLAAAPDGSLHDGARAVELALKANQVSKANNPFFIRTLAAAYAEAGRFDDAVKTAQEASELANAQGQHALAVQIQDETDLFRRHEPLRDQTLTNAQ